MKQPSVLFVCTANICRSPVAEALFRAHLQKMLPEEWAGWRVESAGTWASDGEAISPNSKQVLARRGIAADQHRSKTVNAALLESFDLVLTMEAGHKESILVEFPWMAPRVYLLSEMSGSTVPVSDPYGGRLETYERTAVLLERMIADGFERIAALVKSCSA